MQSRSRLRHLFESSPFGRFAVVWSETTARPVVRRLFLSGRGIDAGEHVSARLPASRVGRDRLVSELARGVRRFLEGEDVSFSLDLIDLDACSPFQRTVLLAEREIPRGRVSTYGGIARHLGIAGGARAIGGALARNPFPIIIPCHRAVCAGGRLGGYQGGVGMKRTLLEHEGALFSDGNRLLNPKLFHV